MEIKKVNNFETYLILRLFIILALCFFTYNITGRIADSEALLGFIDYDASGTRTLTAKNIFSFFSPLNNLYLIIISLSSITSLLTYYLLKKYIDNFNSISWYILFITPGILLYTNTPTKETLFFFPAIIYIILETNSLLITNNISEKFINILLKTLIFLFMYLIRGELAIIYLIVSAVIFIFSNFRIGNYLKKINIFKVLFSAFILSNIILFLYNILFPIESQNLFIYFFKSFKTSTQTRYYIDIDYLRNPLNSITIQYLGLFPSLNELINKPYSTIIFFESVLTLFLYHRIWRNLFKIVEKYNQLKKIIYFTFFAISISYFLIFGTLSSLNLGSGQRFKTNFIPLGLIFPLILEKNIRVLSNKKNIN